MVFTCHNWYDHILMLLLSILFLRLWSKSKRKNIHKNYKWLKKLNFSFSWINPGAFEKSIRGQIVLITGGGSGIGRLMAMKLAKAGAVIVTWDVNTKGNEETAK